MTVLYLTHQLLNDFFLKFELCQICIYIFLMWKIKEKGNKGGKKKGGGGKRTKERKEKGGKKKKKATKTRGWNH